MQRDLNARLAYKRPRLGEATKPLSRAQDPAKWSNGEISTLIYGVLRLGEKEFTDLMNPTLFLKREHELQIAKTSASAVLPDKSRHSAAQISDKWDQIKVLRNLDVDRL